ncbi:MAG TPA: biopolymer transporter ExbD [Burkholderiales bacterium]|nr:biopolymer transporter ExbD [Burkholderiales bacterium]
MAVSLPSGSPSGDPEVMVDINTTPLIDVMLVLLIMLIITIPIQLDSVNLQMPLANPPPPLKPPQVITIDVDFDGTILWDNQVIPDRSGLEEKLQESAQMSPQPEIHVRPNKLVAYKYVAAVLAAAQRRGVTNIGLVGNEQFIE